MPANHVLTFLAIAFRATDQAGIQRRAIAVRLLDHHEPDGVAIILQGEQMQVSVLNFANGNTHKIVRWLAQPGPPAEPNSPARK